MPFRAVPSRAEETLEGVSAQRLAESNALAKVNGAILPDEILERAFVLGTDTVVTVDGRVMGKASTAQEAAEMLAALSGRTHQVVSGVALRRGFFHAAARGQDSACAGRKESGAGETRLANAVTDVSFVRLSERDIEAYIESEEWKGKAGSYAIQGLAGLYVSEVRGEYSNVVGLPLCLLASMFRDLGFDLARRTWL